MAKKEAPETLDIFDHYDPTALVAAVRRLHEGEYISGVELAAILEANPDKVLPPEFRQYLVRFLLGEVPAKRGPKPRSDDLHQFQLLLLWVNYNRILRASQIVDRCARARAKAHGERLPRVKDAAFQLALRYIRQRMGLFPHLSPRALHNLISSQRKLRK